MSLSFRKFPSRTRLLESSVDFRNGPHRVLSSVMSRRPDDHSERHHPTTIAAAPGDDAQPGGGGGGRGDLSTPRAGPSPQFVLWSTTEGPVLARGSGSVRLLCRFSYDRRVYRPPCDVMENDPVDGRGCPRVDAHYGDTLRIKSRIRTNR